jgi:molybdopterin synthase catalytic subunit
MNSIVTIRVTADEALSLDAAFTAVHRLASGATALLVGTIRSPDAGQKVVGLAYEATSPTVTAEMERLGIAIARRYGLVAVYLAHRIGVVPAGQAHVIVAASAKRRAEALAGCRELIDELKRTVPIVKSLTYLEQEDDISGRSERDPTQRS